MKKSHKEFLKVLEEEFLEEIPIGITGGFLGEMHGGISAEVSIISSSGMPGGSPR